MTREVQQQVEIEQQKECAKARIESMTEGQIKNRANEFLKEGEARQANGALVEAAHSYGAVLGLQEAMRFMGMLLLAVLVGCIPLTESPAGPEFGQDSVAELSARANAIWRRVEGQRGYTMIVHRAVGTPSAVWFGRTVEVFVPPLANGKIADAIMAYEISKVNYIIGDGSVVSNWLQPARQAGAALHTPPSEILSWYDVAEAATGDNLHLRR